MKEQAAELVSLFHAGADAPPAERNAHPVLSSLAGMIASVDQRGFLEVVSQCLLEHGLPAPPPGFLAMALRQANPNPRPPVPMPGSRPRFAFVMGNYNDSKWLPRCLPALCNQSRRPDQVLVIDDNSSDGSVSILEDFKNRYDFFDYKLNSENTGPCTAIKNHWHMVEADYVIFAASDDLISTDFLATIEPIIQQHPGVGAVHGMTYVWFVESGGTALDYPTHLIRHVQGYHSPGEFRRFLLGNTMTINANVVCFRKDLIDRFGMFDPSLEHSADIFLFQQVLLEGGVYFIEVPLGIFSRHASQYSTVNTRDLTRRIAVNNRLIDRWACPEHAKFRADIARYPALLENYPMLIHDLAWRTDAWDLLIGYASWANLRAAGAAGSMKLLRQ